MSGPAGDMQRIASILLDHESRSPDSSVAPRAARDRVLHKLRTHLGRLLGLAGFDALLARSARRAGVPLAEAAGDAERDAALLASLLGLLSTFIGEDLTTRAVRQVWPELPLEREERREREP